MPRGNPHKQVMIRLDRAVEAEARELAGHRGFSAAVTEGLRWWIARERRRRRGHANSLAKYPAPPTERELKARKREAVE